MRPHLQTNVGSSARLQFLWLELTPKCNLSCFHCYTESSPRRKLGRTLSATDGRRILLEGAAMGCRSVQFIGGEPPLHPVLPGLIEDARGASYDRVEVYTNGVSISPALKRRLVASSVALAFSVYADNAEIHDAVTQRSGSFAKTVETIRWALAAGLPVRAGVITTARNRAAAGDSKTFLQGLGVADIRIDHQRPVGRGADGAFLADPIDALCGRCADGRLCVSSDGRIYPCVFSRFKPVGSAPTGLAAAMAGPALRDFGAALAKRNAIIPGASAQCVPLGDPCIPEEGHPCVPLGGRKCVPLGGACTPEVPPCGPDGACVPTSGATGREAGLGLL